jgi:hypothetical protein
MFILQVFFLSDSTKTYFEKVLGPKITRQSHSHRFCPVRGEARLGYLLVISTPLLEARELPKAGDGRRRSSEGAAQGGGRPTAE